MCIKLLGDAICYKIRSSDLPDTYKSELNDLLSRGKTINLISPSEFDFLIPRFPQVATFYILPKIHKGQHPLKGRPFNSGVGSFISELWNIHRWSTHNFCLNTPIIYERYNWPSEKTLRNNAVDAESWLASIEVEALYTSIPHNLGTRAVEHFL